MLSICLKNCFIKLQKWQISRFSCTTWAHDGKKEAIETHRHVTWVFAFWQTSTTNSYSTQEHRGNLRWCWACECVCLRAACLFVCVLVWVFRRCVLVQGSAELTEPEPSDRAEQHVMHTDSQSDFSWKHLSLDLLTNHLTGFFPLVAGSQVSGLCFYWSLHFWDGD